MNPLPLAHASALLAAGYCELGVIPTPEGSTQYFVHPAGCRLAVVSEIRGRTWVRAYDAHPLEVFAVATLCLRETGTTDPVRQARQQLMQWGLSLDQAHTETVPAGVV